MPLAVDSVNVLTRSDGVGRLAPVEHQESTAGPAVPTEPVAAAEPDDDVVDLATRLFDLARAGSTDRLAAYVDAGVPVDLSNQSGDTLTMLAAYHGHAGTVRALLERGADPDRPNDRGQTPLAGAVFRGEADVVRALLGGGADPQAGRPSALDTASLFARQDLLDLMHRR